MTLVTLVGLPAGTSHANVTDPETGIVFDPYVPVEVDDSTVERLKSVEQFGFAFYIGDPAALDTVSSPDDVPSPDPQPDPTPAADAASPQ